MAFKLIVIIVAVLLIIWLINKGIGGNRRRN